MKRTNWKKSLLVACTGALAVTAFAVYGLTERETVASPETSATSVVKKGKVHGQLQVLSFEESIKQADLIAKVKIGDKVREFDEPSPKTIFQAEILQPIKASGYDKGSIIHVMQQGNSAWDFNENELFQPGEEYLLFMKQAVGIAEKNTYWLLGEETNMYKSYSTGDLMKLAHRYPVLDKIEDKEKTKQFKEMSQKYHNKEIQMFNEKDFIDQVNQLLLQ